MNRQINKKRKVKYYIITIAIFIFICIFISIFFLIILKLIQFIADGVFSAELNNFLRQELSKEGYSGLELRVVPPATEITILATRTADLIGNQARKFVHDCLIYFSLCFYLQFLICIYYYYYFLFFNYFFPFLF